MRTPFFHIVTCSALLGVMTGAALIHALQFMESNYATGGNLEIFKRERSRIARKVIPAVAPQEGTVASPPSVQSGELMTLKALEEIVARLQELKSANHELRDINVDLQEQLRETNRDLNELQFRVDTHSESFRPLRVPSGSEASLLWNSGMSGEALHPLLPPKE